MDIAFDSANVEVRSAKRARLEELDTAPTTHLHQGSHSAEPAVFASRQPAVHTKALRSVLKGVDPQYI